MIKSSPTLSRCVTLTSESLTFWRQQAKMLMTCTRGKRAHFLTNSSKLRLLSPSWSKQWISFFIWWAWPMYRTKNSVYTPLIALSVASFWNRVSLRCLLSSWLVLFWYWTIWLASKPSVSILALARGSCCYSLCYCCGKLELLPIKSASLDSKCCTSITLAFNLFISK